PRDGCVTIAVNAESAPARTHASEDMRDANTPAMRAVSGAAAAARSASPYLLFRRNTINPRTTSGPNTSIAMYARVTRRPPMRNVGNPLGSGYWKPAPAVALSARANPTTNAPTASVATTLMILGAFRSRRTTAASATPPTSPPIARPNGNATQYGIC